MRFALLPLALGCVLCAQVLPDAEIRTILAERIDKLHQGVGIVVGIVTPEGRRFVSYGTFAVGDARPVAPDTIFEIGSVTKVFTSLLLADMVQHGEVSLDDPVAKYLPSEVKVPERDGKQITLIDLATHTSGLPRMPTNFAPKDAGNPYADYTVEQMYKFLADYTLPRDIGSKMEYSNFGVGLLGHALARRAGMNYETLMRTRIATPLRMENTRIILSAGMKERLAKGHNDTRQPVPNWDLPTFAGAGALRSDARDMLEFVAAHAGLVESPLAPAMAAMAKVRRPMGPKQEIALAWIVNSADGREIRWHNGGTGGYRTFIGYDPKARTGVVVLSNMSTAVGVDDIGMHLLNPAAPLAKLNELKEHKEVHVEPATFDKYVGQYQLAPGAVITISREGDRFYAQLTGQPRFDIFAEGDRQFFFKVVDAQLTFEEGAVVLHQNGRDQRAKKI